MQHHGQFRWYFRGAGVLAVVSLAMTFVSIAGAQTITNLHQLTQTLSSVPQASRDVDLRVTVCAASRAKVGVLIVRDETGVELLEVGDFGPDILPGEQIRIHHNSCLLRKREPGVEISASPVVNNDGLHGATSVSGAKSLAEGKIPLRLEWFNNRRLFGLDVSWANTNEPPKPVEASSLSHTVITESGETNFLPGLQAEYYEDAWGSLPDFNLLRPVKTVVTTNFDLGIRSRDEKIGIRYSGYLEVPHAGQYQFLISSDDGAMLFLGNPNVPVTKLGQIDVPMAKAEDLWGSGITNQDEQHWTVVEGRVSFVMPLGEGVCFDLRTDRNVISVRVTDASGLNLTALQNARVRVTGLGQSVMTVDRTPVLGKLFAASGKDIVFVEQAPEQNDPTLPITSVARVQSLPIERAGQSLPVRLRGIVTDATRIAQERWLSVQDDTRGIFVKLNTFSNSVPKFGDLLDIEGHSGVGDFAPIIIADKIARLGEGLLPSPVTPTWTQLLNGSRDVQWAELNGRVTDVRTNTLSIRLPEGRITIELEGYLESELKPLLNAVIKIRGVLYAVWDATTREVRVGRVMMRNATISVEVPAPADPFDAVERTPRRLLLFDAQASAFRPVKVRGQIIYADAIQMFLEENGAGLRLLPVEKPDVHPGDIVEAVGCPDIGQTQLLLRDALLRKTGSAPLPKPKNLDAIESSYANPNSIRVRVEGKLLGWHVEQGSPVLEMQFGNRLYLARVARIESGLAALRPGSRLALEGVYVGGGRGQNSKTDNESFELLLNSFADVSVLSEPSWWTLPRLLTLVGFLLVILILTVIWNNQLRRVVGQRTNLLQHEIRERERVEHQSALEAERSRIARDLHDDLGSSLTEITVLASTGQLKQTSVDKQSNLFQTIGAKARSLISALDVIVWAVDPEDNSLQSLADYLSGYADEFFSHTKIACRFKVPVSFPSITLDGRVRHELLMAVKEALNNILRHADASEVEFRMAMADNDLEIDIADDGKGIEDTVPGSGHGLKNLSARLQKLGGSCLVQSRFDGGTVVRFRLPLTPPAKEDRDQAGKQ